MNAFVLIIMTCSGHVNAECNFSYQRFPSAQECAEEMMSSEDRQGLFGSHFVETKHDLSKVMCIDSRSIIFPETNESEE